MQHQFHTLQTSSVEDVLIYYSSEITQKLIVDNMADKEGWGMRPQGRARGLMTVWEWVQEEQWERLRRGGIWTLMVKVPGWGRVATLALLHEMAVQNVVGGRRGRRLTCDQFEDQPSSGKGRARNRNSGPCPSPEPLLCLLYTWPQCLCRHRQNLPALLSPPSSESEDSTSGPPSLESITGSELGYEVSGSASTTD